MGRKDRYITHVQPKLEDIKKWICSLTEGQIAKRLGIAHGTFVRYKKSHPELAQALIDGNEELKVELKETLKKKAKGFTYEETKTTRKIEGNKVVSITQETFQKYAPPDTAAIHLLLKNLDDEWRNDDLATLKIKQKQVEIAEKKAEENAW